MCFTPPPSFVPQLPSEFNQFCLFIEFLRQRLAGFRYRRRLVELVWLGELHHSVSHFSSPPLDPRSPSPFPQSTSHHGSAIHRPGARTQPRPATRLSRRRHHGTRTCTLIHERWSDLVLVLVLVWSRGYFLLLSLLSFAHRPVDLPFTLFPRTCAALPLPPSPRPLLPGRGLEECDANSE